MPNLFIKEVTEFVQRTSASTIPGGLELNLHLIADPGKCITIQAGEVQNVVNVVQIWEDQWFSGRTIVQNRLRSMMGLGKRMHARSMKVVRIDKQTANAFLNRYHLQGSTAAYYKLGLYAGTDLVAVATFSKARIMRDKIVPYRSYEWERFATAGDLAIRGGLAKMFTFFTEMVNPAHVMTYIDKDWSTGRGFEAIGFRKETEIEPRQYYVKPGEWKRFREYRSPDEGYSMVYNSGSIRMVKDFFQHS